PDGSSITLAAAGPDGSTARYDVQIQRDDSLPDAALHGYYLRAFDPATAFVRIRNTGSGALSYKVIFNDKFGKSSAEIAQEIPAMPEEFPGEPLHRKAWRFLRDNRRHGDPLTSARWYHSPALLLNSAGFGYCDDDASAYYFLVSDLGYTSRVWSLNGHVVPEV